MTELTFHRAAWCILAAILALTSCTASRATTEHAIPAGTIPATVTTIPLRASADRSIAVSATPTPEIAESSPNPQIDQEAEPEPTPVPVADTRPGPAASESAVHDVRPPASSSSGVEQWRALAVSVFGANAQAALNVMACESRGDPNATSSQGAEGLMQIMPRWHADATYEPLGNLRAAYRISNGGTNWSAWSCQP